MIPIYLESPFRGLTREETRQNIIYARMCMIDALNRGEAPFLSHLLYTQVWSERFREQGLWAGSVIRNTMFLGTHTSLHVFYCDLGMTEGMQLALRGSPFDRARILTREIGGINRNTLGELRLNPFPELDGIYDIQDTAQQ